MIDTTSIESAVRSFINNGTDPRRYRSGISKAMGCTPEEWDAECERQDAPKATGKSPVVDRDRRDLHCDTVGLREQQQAEREFDRREEQE